MSCIIVGTRMNIVRKRFALLDILNNYSFSYVDGADQEDIYPGSYMLIILLCNIC